MTDHATKSRQNAGADGASSGFFAGGARRPASLDGGQPLPSGERRFFEHRIGADLGGVRVHTDEAAAQLSAGMNAKAFSYGQDIFFSRGRWAPDRPEGRRLLAHELAHTVQQRTTGKRVQRQDEGDQPGSVGYFAVQVTREMSAEETLVEFVRQYRNVDEAEARRLIGDEGWAWYGDPTVITREDVLRTYRIVQVRDRSLRSLDASDRERLRSDFGQISRGDQRAINDETYRRFRARSRFRGPLDASSDPRLRSYWHRIREEILAEREAVRNLPDPIREFIFDQSGTGGRRITPADYPALLRIADKLSRMSAADRDRYLASTTARTTDLSIFESSLDRFVARLETQREATVEREQAKAALMGLEEVYERYTVWKAFQEGAERSRGMEAMLSGGISSEGAGMSPTMGGQSLGMQIAASQQFEELTALLAEHGFASVWAFERAIARFKEAFRSEAVLIAQDMLTRYEHVLWTQDERYQDSDTVRRLHGQLGQARAHYREADRITAEHAVTPGPFSADEDLAQMQHYVGLRHGELRQGFGAMRELAEENPLFHDIDFPTQAIATASAGRLQSDLRRYIADRRRDLIQTRGNLAANPDLVWDLDIAIERTRAAQDIRRDSVYDRILRDAQRDRSLNEAMVNLAVAVIAIAAGLISAGGGTVGVLAAGAAFGISAFQAYDEFRRYESRAAAHGAQLLSDDPSLVWLIVALAGAGLDAAGVAAALRAGGGALSTAARSVTTLEELGAVTTAASRAGLSDEAVAHVVAAARAELEANAAWTAARAGHQLYGALDPIVTPALILGVRFSYPMYMSLRQGIFGIERFLMTRRVVNLIGDFRQMSPAALARVREAYSIALGNAQRVAAHGHRLGLLDQEIERFLLMWNRFPEMTVDGMIAQLDQLAAPLAARANARSRIAPQMVLDDASGARLADFDRQIAGTGGIESIGVRAGPEGELVVTIEGEVLPQRLTRDSRQVTATRRRAPSFNDRYPIRAGDLGLSGDDWHRLHLWGPGFGDEAAAGMFWGPKRVNLEWQNESIETYIRGLGELAAQRGGRVRVRARAVAWERPTPGGFNPPMGENFLKEVNYDISLIRPGEPPTTITVNLQLAEPPSPAVRSFTVDPPGAINLGDLF